MPRLIRGLRRLATVPSTIVFLVIAGLWVGGAGDHVPETVLFVIDRAGGGTYLGEVDVEGLTLESMGPPSEPIRPPEAFIHVPQTDPQTGGTSLVNALNPAYSAWQQSFQAEQRATQKRFMGISVTKWKSSTKPAGRESDWVFQLRNRAPDPLPLAPPSRRAAAIHLARANPASPAARVADQAGALPDLRLRPSGVAWEVSGVRGRERVTRGSERLTRII